METGPAPTCAFVVQPFASHLLKGWNNFSYVFRLSVLGMVPETKLSSKRREKERDQRNGGEVGGMGQREEEEMDRIICRGGNWLDPRRESQQWWEHLFRRSDLLKTLGLFFSYESSSTFTEASIGYPVINQKGHIATGTIRLETGLNSAPMIFFFDILLTWTIWLY